MLNPILGVTEKFHHATNDDGAHGNKQPWYKINLKFTLEIDVLMKFCCAFIR